MYFTIKWYVGGEAVQRDIHNALFNGNSTVIQELTSRQMFRHDSGFSMFIIWFPVQDIHLFKVKSERFQSHFPEYALMILK